MSFAFLGVFWLICSSKGSDESNKDVNEVLFGSVLEAGRAKGSI